LEHRPEAAASDIIMASDICNPTLHGGNIIEHMKHVHEVKDAQWRYFYWQSRVFKAIQQHIERAEDCVLIQRHRKLLFHRGHGAVSFNDAHHYVGEVKDGQHVPSKVFNLMITVHFGEDEENDLGAEDRKYYLNVPIDLELDFSPAKFDAWIEGLRQERDAKQLAKDTEDLKRLIGKNPKLVRKLLREAGQSKKA
jgi:hypothetical protein